MMSPKEVVFRSAVYFEKKGFVEKAVILYRKAGANKKAIDLATKHNLPIPKQDEDDKVNENDPSSMNNKINSLIESGRYDRAVPILVSAKQYDKAFELCLQYSVPIPDDLVKKMFPDTMPPDEVQKKADLIRNVADRLRKQGSFDIASQLYVKLGDKSKAMKCLIELGDQEKVITFAVNARTPEIYILAGNFLQTADWHKNSELVKHIINFYNKAKAHDNLAGFFEACSSLEIDEYRNYEKALAALKESLKHAQKSTAEDK
jgi:intraflagellar transport protein 140